MSISKEKREAYQKGREQAKYIRENTFSFALSGGINSRPEDPELAAAFDKGLSEEKLDEDKNG